jgi:hypothetical protein
MAGLLVHLVSLGLCVQICRQKSTFHRKIQAFSLDFCLSYMHIIFITIQNHFYRKTRHQICTCNSAASNDGHGPHGQQRRRVEWIVQHGKATSTTTLVATVLGCSGVPSQRASRRRGSERRNNHGSGWSPASKRVKPSPRGHRQRLSLPPGELT